MNPGRITVKVPATTANLGPGFDCLALAVDLWNEADFCLEGRGITLDVQGEGEGLLPTGEENSIAQAALLVYRRLGVPAPQGLHITCRNSIPLGSGLGSSASAALLGLLGANSLLGNPISQAEILRMASEIEGHPDNAAAALLGGLVVVISQEGEPITRRFDLSMLQAALVTPRFDLPTHAARAALPQKVSMQDAVFNLGRTALVVEALRSGDLDLLGQVMQDRLHQPYRLPLIPGAAEALQAARTAGAKAAAISGAGPSLIAFGGRDLEAVAQAMQAAFMQAGLACRRAAVLNVSNQGALIYSAA